MNSFNMDSVRFIMPLYGFYNQLIQNAGYDIRNPYKGNAFFPRVFREIHFRLNLPGQSIWYNPENITDKPYIIVYEPLITPAYLNWLHKKNKNAIIILDYINKINEINSPKQYKAKWLSIWTSDKEDSEKYGINLYEGLSFFRHLKVQKESPEFDVFFVGKDKGRIDELEELERKFNSLGIKTFFYIVAGKKYSIKKDKRHKPFMPYADVLKNIGKTKAILHLIQGGQKGITIRVVESLVFKKKLITDSIELQEFDFYHPDNIFILGKDKIEDLPIFLEKPYKEIESKYFEKMYFEDTVQEIIEKTVEETKECK